MYNIRSNMLDKDLNLEVVLVYTTFENLDVITRSVRVKNCAKDSITLTKYYQLV